MRYLFLVLVSFLFFSLSVYAEEEPTAKGEAAEEAASYEDYYEALRKKYEELVDESGKRSSEAYSWVQKDFKNMFSWEYRVEVLSLSNQEKLSEKLTELGLERWELVQVVPKESGNEAQLFFKRRPKSYMKSVPLKDLLRLFPFGGGAGPVE